MPLSNAVTCHNQPADARALIRGEVTMSKPRLSARTKKRRAADKEVIYKMHDIFQKVKKCEHELTDTILSIPYFKAR